MRILASIVLVGLMVLSGVHDAFGQASTTGGIRGAVRDQNGVVPGAEVTLTNEATNQRRTTHTNEAGEYVFTAVPPGTYGLKAGLTGFKTYEQSGLRIGTQTFITQDVTLSVGQIEESVEVKAQSPLVESSNASQGQVLDSKALESLPAPGRTAFLMAIAVPTVVPSGDAQFNRQQDQTNASLLSLGGGGRRANNYLLDGVPITDLRNRPSAHPTMEGIEEVKVQVHTYDAQMGSTGGGVFNTAMKSGTNILKGSGFTQIRPVAGQANNYFQKLAGIPKPEGLTYRLAGGGVGGPIIRDKTFFWFATEGYRDNQPRNGAHIFPTSRERRGDFTQTFNRSGQLVAIDDPLTTRPDPNNPGRFIRDQIQCNGQLNVICPDRINPVAAAMAEFFPQPDTDVSNQNINFRRTATIINQAEMYTGKVDHKFSDKVSLSGFYLYNNTDEPCSNYWEPGLKGEKHFADPLDYLLKRRVHVLAINNTYIPTDRSVATFRVGWTRFADHDTLTQDFDPSKLPFNPAFINAIVVKKFPAATIDGYGEGGATNRAIGAIAPTQRLWWSWSANGSYSRFFGGHTVKSGADFRRAGLDGFRPGQSSGDFRFDRYFTSADPLLNGTATSGNSFASFLLGFPSGDSNTRSFIPIAQPLQVYGDHYAAYVQDDWRVTSKLTVNAGIRFEKGSGLREKENRFTVAFDRTAPSPLNVTVPADVVAGMPARQVTGGLRYAGQDGFPTHQGNPPSQQWAPRFGVVYSLDPRTVVRGGYGLFWAPANYPSQDDVNYGQIGFTRQTFISQSQFIPTVTLSNPFPAGVLQPVGNSLGLLTGVGGGDITFIDQDRKAPYVQQYSADFQRELSHSMAVSVGYIGARGDHLSLGAADGGQLNINELDPSLLQLGSALLDAVPNPFFGNPNAGALATTQTVQRRQLLRPFPEFGNVFMLGSTKGKSRYNAAVVKLTRRVAGWGGTFNYTYSVLKDNQFGQNNFYSRTPRALPLSSYNLDAEYGYSIIDVPHRLVLAPIAELPFGKGRKWLNTGGVTDALLGGWSIAALMNFESGFPITVEQNSINTNTFGGTQRPNVVSGVDPNTAGSRDARFTNYIDPNAYTLAPAFTLGNAPRTNPNLRTPHRNNIDGSFAKDFRLRGSLRAQLKVEITNLTNTVKVRGPEQRLGQATFGDILVQAGFMRITQAMFRLTF